MNELKLLSYSVDFSAPRAAALIQRVEEKVNTLSREPAPGFFDLAFLDVCPPLEDPWMGRAADDEGMLMA
jgi:hypothetical protein